MQVTHGIAKECLFITKCVKFNAVNTVIGTRCVQIMFLGKQCSQIIFSLALEKITTLKKKIQT